MAAQDSKTTVLGTDHTDYTRRRFEDAAAEPKSRMSPFVPRKRRRHGYKLMIKPRSQLRQAFRKRCN